MNNSEEVCCVCRQRAQNFVDWDSQIICDATVKINSDSLDFARCFKYCTQLEIAEDGKICYTCGQELLVTYSFLRKVEKNTKRKLNFSLNNNIKYNIEIDGFVKEENMVEMIEENSNKNYEIIELMVRDDDDDQVEDDNNDYEQLIDIVVEKDLDKTDEEDFGEANEDETKIESEHVFETESTCKANQNDIESNYNDDDDDYKDRYTDAAYFCEICGDQIPKTETIREHYMLHSSSEETIVPLDYHCTICGKSFSSQGFLNSHLKYHDRKSTFKSDACKICGKRFSSKHYLGTHMSVHSDNRQQFECKFCDRLYMSKTTLDNHMRIHIGETFVCPDCGKHFGRMYELNVHRRFHTKDYPFACEVCDKKFAIKGHLRTHMWSHQGLKLQCEDCGKLFRSTKALNEHSYSHTTMPFPCSYCSKGYPSKQKYKIHLKNVHFLELNEEELQKVAKNQPKREKLPRKKLTLVQADSVMKEVEIKFEESTEI